MKFSNILYAFIAFCGLGLLASCEVNNEFYDQLDKHDGFQFVIDTSYTLTSDDYDSMGKESGQPGKYNNFSEDIVATEFLPAFLNDKYPTLDVPSTIKVTYDYYRGGIDYLNDYLDYLEVLAAIDSYTLTTADYDSMGTAAGEPGKYNNFDATVKASDYLPDFLLAKYPAAADGDELAVTYKFYNGSTTSMVTEFWTFDGSVWAKSNKVAPSIPDDVELYELTSDDYDAMGTGSSQPGQYNNFSSSIVPENYLSIFLGVKFPYASNGDKFALLYKYYAGGGVTETRAKEYTLTDGIWLEYQSTIAKTDQYVRSTAGWVFDPSVLYTMGEEDYQMIVDYVKNNIEGDYINTYGTGESYFGVDAHYKEFAIADGKFEATKFDTWQDAVKAGVAVYLPLKFPSAVAQVDGVDVNYIITFAGYVSSMVDYTITFKCTKSGPSPEFEYVEGPTLK
ncbi:hypothetical protein [Labilibaculum manganireducens]|uniref:hypothetical protein n=1 Tax=Labilibaculum manganireducens TaxID=1940525 RepID=UPI0029F5B894|nr:hypothetical protein [Labilibaculum manganireducens]